MRNLINFLIRFSSWILFMVFVTISCVLLFQNNPYQHSIYLSSANALSTSLYNGAHSVTSYFSLRDINEDLTRRNAQLESQVLALKSQIARYKIAEYAATVPVDTSLARYNFIIAHVINNSVHRPHNYITLDTGSLDGIAEEMGVVNENGVVGIVNKVGPHSARVISVLNNYLRVSAKVKASEQVGSLVWDGKNPSEAILEELPRHATFKVGDTVVTNGYSTVFPEGVPVGIVTKPLKDYDENFFALRVRLFTDFSTLNTVRVVRDMMKPELLEVESDEEPQRKF
ncbi:MAG: rod shape-determining protein MreC [Muribaculaceae bacterium]|nr:rod shape-determining protein MreC [Muribaculaceae bacterium]